MAMKQMGYFSMIMIVIKIKCIFEMLLSAAFVIENGLKTLVTTLQFKV